MWRVAHEWTKLSTNAFWNRLINLKTNDTHGQIDVFETFYWVNRGILFDKYQIIFSMIKYF